MATAMVTVCEKMIHIRFTSVLSGMGRTPVLNLVTMERDRLLQFFDETLEPSRFQDYGPNGLQVQGRPEVRKIVSGVTASLAFIEAAIQAQADALFVHHGLFWRGQSPCVTGWMRQRLGRLLAADVSLFAYHLPLDAHASLGNNATLGERLGLLEQGRFGDQNLGFIGVPQGDPGGVDIESLTSTLHERLGRPPLIVVGTRKPMRTIAWCSGGAQNYLEAAIAAGADAFITGEISEPQAHLAREAGVNFFACGHHATERFGAPAMAAHAARAFGLEHEFIDVDNPA